MFNRLSKLAIAATVVLVPTALSAQVAVTPANGGYSVVFPEKPQEKEVALSPTVKTTVYSVNRGDASFLAGYTEYKEKMDVDKELAADVQSFVQQLQGRILERRRSVVKLPSGAPVEQVEFLFENEKTSGHGIAVMTNPQSSIMIAGLTNKTDGKPADVDAFVKSFKLAADK